MDAGADTINRIDARGRVHVMAFLPNPPGVRCGADLYRSWTRRRSGCLPVDRWRQRPRRFEGWRFAPWQAHDRLTKWATGLTAVTGFPSVILRCRVLNARAGKRRTRHRRAGASATSQPPSRHGARRALVPRRLRSRPRRSAVLLELEHRAVQRAHRLRRSRHALDESERWGGAATHHPTSGVVGVTSLEPMAVSLSSNLGVPIRWIGPTRPILSRTATRVPAPSSSAGRPAVAARGRSACEGSVNSHAGGS